MKEDAFFQEAPRLANTFEADAALQETLARLLPGPEHAALLASWRALGEAAAGPLQDLARQAEAEPPRHRPFDAWGRRVDEIEVSPAWTALHREAARWGLCAVPYEPDLGPHARLHQFALLHLYAPSSAIYTCHLAMTDGAARTLLTSADEALQRRALPRLTSRDPEAFWTSGQWMTERAGGSDVSGTATVAARGEDGRWRLRGSKWFTSAITSEVALTLARVEEGLSLFYLEQQLADGRRNGIRIDRLKDKLGTRALPTAELTLEGTLAEPVGELGRGVRTIAPLLNITRLHNAVNACAMMARLLQLLRDYARRRVVFGEALALKPLHRETLADLQVEYEAGLALTFECARLLGRQESGEASEGEQSRLRLLTPLAKLLTAKQAVAVASEALEGFGGAGYIEDTGLPVWLRNAQVLPIWEGTTNVLSLDVLRVLAREGSFESWAQDARARAGALGEAGASLLPHLDEIARFLPRATEAGPEFAESAARRFALKLAGVAAALPLAEQGVWASAHGRGPRAAGAAHRWVAERVPALFDPGAAGGRLAQSLALSGLGEDA